MNIVTTGDRADMFMYWLVSDADANHPELLQHMVDAVRETACTGQKGTHSACLQVALYLDKKTSVSKHPSSLRGQRADEAIPGSNFRQT